MNPATHTTSVNYYYVKATAIGTRNENAGKEIPVYICNVRGMTDSGQPAFSTSDISLIHFNTIEEAQSLATALSRYGYDFKDVRDVRIIYVEKTVVTTIKESDTTSIFFEKMLD